MLGGSSKAVYAIALFASGQSSTITGTYAGQFIMQVINHNFYFYNNGCSSQVIRISINHTDYILKLIVSVKLQ